MRKTCDRYFNPDIVVFKNFIGPLDHLFSIVVSHLFVLGTHRVSLSGLFDNIFRFFEGFTV